MTTPSSPHWPDHPDCARFAALRRARLADRLAALGLAGAIITDPRDVLYLTAAPLAAPAPACLLIHGTDSPASTLVCGQSDTTHHADRIMTYPWHTGGTISSELVAALAETVVPLTRSFRGRLGVQMESLPVPLFSRLDAASILPIDRDIAALQRGKDDLDLFAIGAAIDSNLAAIVSARAAIAPGVREIDVFAAASRGACLQAGRRVHHDGDYRCGAPGGAPRDRAIEPGELYIVDAWTQRDGYWSDLARTYPVSAEASRLQLALLEHLDNIHQRIRPHLSPGRPCREIWKAMDAMLREFPQLASSGLVHHGGHGVGLRLHEHPDINPDSPDVLQAGDVICIEPGGYFPEARAGARIEQTYFITEAGPQCLSCTSPG